MQSFIITIPKDKVYFDKRVVEELMKDSGKDRITNIDG